MAVSAPRTSNSFKTERERERERKKYIENERKNLSACVSAVVI